MFSKNQISLFIIVFSFMIMIGVGLRAHPIHITAIMMGNRMGML